LISPALIVVPSLQGRRWKRILEIPIHEGNTCITTSTGSCRAIDVSHEDKLSLPIRETVKKHARFQAKFLSKARLLSKLRISILLIGVLDISPREGKINLDKFRLKV